MDIFCLIIIIGNGLSGFIKGLIKMLFAFFGVILVAFLAYELVGVVYNTFVGSSLTEIFYTMIKNAFDGLLAEEFTSVEDLIAMLSASNVNVIVVSLIRIILQGVEVDGPFTCGSIVADKLTKFIVCVIIFVLLFILINFIMKGIRKLLEKLIKKAGLNFANRLLGFLLGVLKGVIICAVIIFVLSSLSSFIPVLSRVIESGRISSYVYNNVFLKVFDYFYSIIA